MKKTIIIVLFTVLVLSLPLLSGKSNNKRFFASFETGLLFPSDGGYKDIYGSSVFYPEIEIGFKAINNIYIVASYNRIIKTGTTVIFDAKAKSTQNIFSFGVGFEGKISDKFGYGGEIGASSFSYKEEALGESIDGSKTGFFINGVITYNINDSLFANFITGYNRASDTVNGVGIKLGGFHILAGMGIRF